MRHLAFAAVTVCASALIVAACSGDDGSSGNVAAADGGTGGSSGSSGSSGTSGTSGPPACTPLDQLGASVDVIISKPPKPEATGGPAVDGTFVLTSVKAFTDIFPDGNKLQVFGAYTLVLGGGGTTFEQVVTNRDGKVTRAKGALVIDGTSFTATPDCEDPLNADGGVTVLKGNYTSEGTALKMYVVRELSITAELLFQKQ